MNKKTNNTEIWLKNLDKIKLRVKDDVRRLDYKHTYYPARRVARQVWLDSKTYSEFVKRCGFFANSSMASDWDYAFSKIYNRKLKATRSRAISRDLANVLKMI